MYKLFLAWRYLLSRKIIFFAIAGVAVGVMVLIVVTSVMGGFTRDMRERIRGISSHMSVTIPEGFYPFFEKYQPIMDKIKSMPHVTACAPKIEWWGLLFAPDNRPFMVRVIGIDPTSETKVSNFNNYLTGDKIFNFKASKQEGLLNQGAIIGSVLYNKLFYLIANEPAITLSTGGLSDALLYTTQKQFTVTGRFHTGLFEHDYNVVYLDLKSLQDFLTVSGVTKISIALDDYKHAEKVRSNIYKTLGDKARYFHIQTWEDEKRTLLNAVSVEKVINAVILFFVIIVAGFNIAAMLTMRVLEKTKDIGILRALGSPTKGIMTLFLYQGLLISLMGSIIGVVLGYLIASNLNPIEAVLTKLFGFKLFPPNIYYLDKIPSEISIPTIVIIVVATVACSIIFSIYPAIRAARFEPADALRYE